MRILISLVLGSLLLTPPPVARAEAVVAARMIRSQTILGPQDVSLSETEMPGALQDPAEAVGREARVNIYAGRPIRPADLVHPAIIERNQTVKLNYFHAGLSIVTEGRSLDRAGPGDRIRVMNLDSRSTVSGVVLDDGSVSVRLAAP